MHKSLSAIATALLSLVSQGIGHLFVGAYKRAYILIALTLFNYLFLLFGLPLLYSLKPLLFKYFYWIMMLYLLLYAGFVVYDSIKLSLKNSKPAKLKFMPEQKILRFILLLIAAGAISVGTSLILPSKSVYNYIVPSEAMKPTLQNGDYIIAVEKSGAYLAEMRNAVVTYTQESEPNNTSSEYKIHLGRVAAIEGDKIKINTETGDLIINGNTYPLVNRGPANFEQLKGMYSRISDDPFVKDFWLGKELEIPLGQVFILRDNYSDGIDSRSRGLINVERIGEKVSFIYFSKNATGIQWDRINKNIE